ncbi:MAG: hypothetical protein Q8K36_00675, partial [Alphaproteobacteria bacterium]|nr:hypothetical protein [Alphaproteobacteria bacterium]
MLITISIDAMGGDYGPSEIIPGLALALTHYSAKKPDLDLRFLIFGDEALVQKHLKHHPTLNNHCEVIHSKFHATNIEKP